MTTELDALRRRLSEAIATARADLSDLEEENWRIRRELHLVSSSAGLRVLLAANHTARDVLQSVRHPVAAAHRVTNQLTWRGPGGRVRAVGRRLLVQRTPLRGIPPFEQHTERDDLREAIRWIGAVRMAGETRDALLCHPPSRVSFRVFAAPGARLTAACGLLPAVWASNDGGAVFHLSVQSPDGWCDTATLHMDPRRRWSDRRWRRLSVTVPAGVRADEVTVTLATSLPQKASIVNAWAVWGDPEVRRVRDRREVSRSLGRFATLARSGGVGKVLAHLSEVQAVDTHAELYRQWLSANAASDADYAAMRAESERLPWRPTISILTPVYNTDPRWLRACIESVKRQVYPNWQLCLADDASTLARTRQVLKEYEADPRIAVTYLDTNAHISAASNAALRLATGEFIALLDHDDELTPDALYHIVRCVNEHRDADMIYSDEDKLDPGGGRCDPYFKPDWSPEHFLSCMYTCHFMAARRSLVEEIGGFRLGYEGAQDYDLVLRLTERTGRIHHVPRILYHWRKLPQSAASASDAKPWALDSGRRALEDAIHRRGVAAEVLPGGANGLFRVRFRIQGQPLVSIVIPTRGRPIDTGGRATDHLAVCLRSIKQKTAYPNFEVVLVTDTPALAEASARALETMPHRIVPYNSNGPFNFSHKINVGVRNAGGEHILLLNDDVEVIAAEWLTAMLEYSQQEEIGAVGAKLLYPDGRLQHIGIVLGVCGVAAHAFHQHPGTSTGYASSAVSVRNYSAVTAACMMTRRHVYEEIGGFDERLSVDFNDVDYCLRVRSAGRRIVVTPYAALYHYESASVGPRVQNARELEIMRERWQAVIERDPYYHPSLTRTFADYRIRL